MWLESLDSLEHSAPFVPLALYFSTYQIMLSLCNTLYEMKEARNSRSVWFFFLICRSTCAETLLQLGRCCEFCLTSCVLPEFRLTFMAAAIKVQSSSSRVHIFPVDQLIKYELKRMLQDKSNGTTMNFSLTSIQYESKGLVLKQSKNKARYSL